MKTFLLLSFAIIIKLNVFAQVKSDTVKPSEEAVIRICAPSRVQMLNQPKPLYVLYFGKNQWIVKDIPFDSVKLNPNDIKTINVVRDLKATDKYGNDAKNGVIEITIKKESVRIFRKENRVLLKKG
jgi:hypothetical protein